MLVGWKRISTAVGLLAALASAPGVTRAQAIAPNPNQATAEAVAGAIRSGSSLQGYRIEVQARDGLVTLAGTVASPAQKAQAIALAGRVAGVRGVVDGLRVTGDPRVRPAQYQVAYGGTPPRAYGGTGAPAGGVVNGGMMPGPGYVEGPMAEGPAGMTGGAEGGMPGQNPLGWPSHGGGYPTTYPWAAQANVGPDRPYPEIPLDWRAVTLRWDDGLWWLDFRKHYSRPFFTPYPFQPFAY